MTNQVATEVYKVKEDVTLQRAVSELPPRFSDGPPRYQTEGRNYPVGSYALASNISPPLLERIEDGELDRFLEPVDGEEAEAALSLGDSEALFGTFIPEHEVEAYLLNRYGHATVPRDQVLELKSAGAEAAAVNVQEALDNEPPAEENPLPNFTDEVPSLADVSRGDVDPGPIDTEHIEVPGDLEQPPGLPVGEQLAGAEGGAEAAESAKKAVKPRRGKAKKQESSEGSSSS